MSTIYIVDTSVLITASKIKYCMGFCKGFWDAIKILNDMNMVYSIRRVRDEILRGDKADDLSEWVENELRDNDFWINEHDYVRHYATIMQWAQDNGYTPDACVTLGEERNADPWLIAVAMQDTSRYTVVTEEKYVTPSVKTKIKIPNIAQAHEVRCIDTTDFLKEVCCGNFELKL